MSSAHRSPRPGTGRIAAALAVAVVLAATALSACSAEDRADDTSSTSTTVTSTSTTSSLPPDAPSMVVMGDSVAAGEGIAYGYRYDLDRSRPDRSTWTGGVSDPPWLEPYPLCHQTEEAYGHLVAAEVGARLTSFACTGATYLDGITTPETDGDQVYRPAQFGDWAARKDLNADYDAADPDVVVITLGADDVYFSSIVRFCVGGFTTAELTQVSTLLAAGQPVLAITAAVAERAGLLARAVERNDRSLIDDVGLGWCTEANPGPVIDQLFWKPVRDGELTRHYRELVAAIRERGAETGDRVPPEIVFTTYHHPLPPDLDGDCWDVFPLSSQEQRYLQSLQDTLQGVIEESLAGLKGVSVVDLSRTLDGHEWCTEDPWAYGLSIIWFDDPQSKAPFHPTADGQRAIAEAVTPAVRAALARSGGSTATRR